MAAFPWNLCTVVLSDYRFRTGQTVRRTEFDSGDVAQKRRSRRILYERTIMFHVKHSDISALDTWVVDHGAEYFDFRDWHDNVLRQVRIRGGQVELAQSSTDQLLAGERTMTATIVLEGYK